MNALDLTSCDKEKIHHIHTIQKNGAFLAVSNFEFKIKHVSMNFSEFMGIKKPAESFIGLRLIEVIPSELFHEIQNSVKSHQSFPRSLSLGNWDVYLYKIEQDLIAIEIEMLPELGSQRDTLTVLNQFLSNAQVARNISELSKEACRAIRGLTGMDRVMMYRFYPPTMYGEVIAEDKIAEAHSFMDHRFPATDIPKPARDLYLRNQVRMISDSHDTPAPIYPSSGERGPLDLSDSRLRGVSAIHIEYLKNMHVRGSFSVAVRVDGKLWALIAAHHSSAIKIAHETRSYCNVIANFLAVSLPLLEQSEVQNKELELHRNLNEVYENLKDSLNPQEDLFKLGTLINRVFNVSGFALFEQGKFRSAGITPLTKDCKELAAWISDILKEKSKNIFITNSLVSHDERWTDIKDQASGVVAMKVDESDQNLLLFFRPELKQTVQWGGDPRKNFEQRNYKGQINPRASFGTWEEIIQNTSVFWNQFEIDGIKNFKNLVFDSIISKHRLINELGSKLNR